MFPDFSKLGEVIPKVQEAADKILKEFVAIRDEQKAQRALLEEIAAKLSKGE